MTTEFQKKAENPNAAAEVIVNNAHAESGHCRGVSLQEAEFHRLLVRGIAAALSHAASVKAGHIRCDDGTERRVQHAHTDPVSGMATLFLDAAAESASHTPATATPDAGEGEA